VSITRLEKLYITLLAIIFGGVILHAPISVGLGVLLPDWVLIIKSWKEIVMLLLVPMAAAIIIRRGLWPQIWHDWVARLMMLLAALHLVTMALFFQGVAATLAGLAIDLRYILFFALTYVAVRALPQYRRLFVQIGIIGACIVVGFATLQLLLPPDFLKIIGYSNDTIAPYLTVDKNPDYIRVNSTLRGPNPLGAYAGIVLAVLTAALVKGKLQLQHKKVLAATIALAICGVIALWISYSRSALVAGIVGVVLVVVIAAGRMLKRRHWIAVGVVTAVIAGVLIIGRGDAVVSNVLFHENPSGGSSISSNEGHVESLTMGTERFIRQPLGGGVGSTGSASLYGDAPVIIENQYLFVAHEVGWAGLATFTSLFTLILVRLWRQRRDWLALGVFASGIGLALIGLLLPVWVDDTVSIVWWGLAATVLARGKYESK
jgi:hypothetical protein